MFSFLFSCLIVVTLLSMVFYVLSFKHNWMKEGGSPFECGFSSYFYSRFSFSIHYFLIGLIFLFLDLELSFLMPVLIEGSFSIWVKTSFVVFLSVLLLGILWEWKEKKLDWTF
uniref:NADH-ubiquinone oxidoreductase chain 3 n=1 Tax=Epitrimerus sabinae TaxID=1452570 RepID=A0A0U2PXH1_9ACAR|nr:NADH dehydrogenase subunit 3 [Epitrimerus sabinae]ALK03788.1 NADH dehydrogenase subunit 3 [Epitrimerus sabinae]